MLPWRLSNTMDASFCAGALEEALVKYGKPEIFNTGQGSQFTGGDFTGVLLEAGIRISMDGRGRWMDNVFIECLWRSLKYEDIYLKHSEHYADGREAKAGIFAWNAFTTRSAFIGRWATGRRWRSGAMAPPQWLTRAVDMGTTLTRCPQTHSNSSRRSLWLPDREKKERFEYPTKNHPLLVLTTGSASVR